MTPPLIFVLGGAASGKSALAEDFAFRCGLPRIYIATAQAFDAEMERKIANHQAQRGADWTTIEEPFDLAGTIARAPKGHVILIDCLTLWLTNLLLAERDPEPATDALLTALAARQSQVICVSNEVGQGIVPENALARRFREAQGRLNIRMAAAADTAVQVVAGLPNLLKGEAP